MWPILQGAWMFLSVPELFVITVLLTLLFLIQKLPLSAPKRGMKK